MREAKRDLTGVAQQLRAVYQARRHFLKMAAAERAFIEPMLDRIAEDLGGEAPTAAAKQESDACNDEPDGTN